jgi:putative transposase
MPNYIHLIWQIQDGHKKAKVQQSFLKYTAQQMKFMLAKTNEAEFAKYKVKASDREYQFWERNPLSKDLWNRQVFLQKLNYIHYNPTHALEALQIPGKNIDILRRSSMKKGRMNLVS